MLDQQLKDNIKSIIAMDFEEGQVKNNYDELVDLFIEDGVDLADECAEYYLELAECGPAGIIDEIGPNYFSEEYLQEYGYSDSDDSLDESTKRLFNKILRESASKKNGNIVNDAIRSLFEVYSEQEYKSMNEEDRFETAFGIAMKYIDKDDRDYNSEALSLASEIIEKIDSEIN